MKGIGRELAIDHRTVRKFVASGAFPERARRARGVFSNPGMSLKRA